VQLQPSTFDVRRTCRIHFRMVHIKKRFILREKRKPVKKRKGKGKYGIMKLFVYTSFFAMLPMAAAFMSPPVGGGTRSLQQLQMGLFDKFTAGGSGKDRLDEEWEKQQEILRRRRAPQAEREAYFGKIEKRRQKASQKQNDMWAWQRRDYAAGEDPIDGTFAKKI